MELGYGRSLISLLTLLEIDLLKYIIFINSDFFFNNFILNINVVIVVTTKNII